MDDLRVDTCLRFVSTLSPLQRLGHKIVATKRRQTGDMSPLLSPLRRGSKISFEVLRLGERESASSTPENFHPDPRASPAQCRYRRTHSRMRGARWNERLRSSANGGASGGDVSSNRGIRTWAPRRSSLLGHPGRRFCRRPGQRRRRRCSQQRTGTRRQLRPRSLAARLRDGVFTPSSANRRMTRVGEAPDKCRTATGRRPDICRTAAGQTPNKNATRPPEPGSRARNQILNSHTRPGRPWCPGTPLPVQVVSRGHPLLQPSRRTCIGTRTRPAPLHLPLWFRFIPGCLDH